ncbi:MAG: hypothetical protein M1840_001332 [Geoglossum simile]|nr:MAG: hypothetical protein M1840_001332 [Geoglossum simile]
MSILIILVVLVALSNIAAAEPLRLKNGARFRRIRAAGPGGVSNTQSITPSSISNVVTPEHSPLQSSTTPTAVRSLSKPQIETSATSDSALGTSVVFKFPNGVPAATIFITTAQRSTALSAIPLSESTTTQLTTTPSTTLSTTAETPSAPGQLGGGQPIASSSATSQPLLSQPPVNQSTVALPGTFTAQTTAAGTSQTLPTGHASGTTTIKGSSKVQVTFTIPATEPTSSPIPVPPSNLEMARALNVLFQTLTPDSTCDLTQAIEAAACINGQLAICGSNGAYSLSRCPQGKQCYALPRTGSGTGVEIGCDTTEHAQLILAVNATSSNSVTISTSASVTTRNATTSPTTSSTSPGLAGGPSPSDSVTGPAPAPPTQLVPYTTNPVPQLPVPTTSIAFVPGSMGAPGLPSQLPTDGFTTTITEFITITGSPPTRSTSLEKPRRTDQLITTDEVTTTVTEFITVTGSPPTLSTTLTEPSNTDQSSTPGGISSLLVLGNIAIITKTVTSTATVTETVAATETVRR